MYIVQQALIHLSHNEGRVVFTETLYKGFRGEGRVEGLQQLHRQVVNLVLTFHHPNHVTWQ